MQKSIVFSTKEFLGGKKIDNVFVKGEFYNDDACMFIKKGFILNYSDNEVIRGVAEEGTSFIKKIKGEFFIIYFDKLQKKIIVGNDLLGRETLFYCHTTNNIIFSDDFWEIVNIIEPSEKDIDEQSIKEFIVFRGALFNKTIIKNLNFFPPASAAEFSLAEKKLHIFPYWDVRLLNNSMTIEEAVERLDKALDETMKSIKRMHGNVIYGIGLSGGLDSRLIPYYALKNKMKLRSFIIGEKKPHLLFLSRDHKSARKLAKYYNLKHDEVEYDSESYEEKNFYDIRYFPMGPSNFLIAVRKNIPKFDVLLTGSVGTLVNSVIGEEGNNLRKEELLEIIVSHLTDINPPSSMLKIILRLLFHKGKEHRIKRREIKGIISKEEFEKAINKIREFMEENREKTNFEIYFKYVNFHIASKSKYGTFESLNGYKPSYSIYYPFLMDDIMKWKPDFFKGRKVLRMLLNEKFQDLSKVAGTRPSDKPLFYEKISFKKNFYRIMYLLDKMVHLLRGIGTWNRDKWVNKKDCRVYLEKILLKPNKIFDKLFDAREIIRLHKERKISSRLYLQIVKTKQLLDLIVTKDYKKFINN